MNALKGIGTAIVSSLLVAILWLYVNFCGEHRKLDLGVVRVLDHYAA